MGHCYSALSPSASLTDVIAEACVLLCSVHSGQLAEEEARGALASVGGFISSARTFTGGSRCYAHALEELQTLYYEAIVKGGYDLPQVAAFSDYVTGSPARQAVALELFSQGPAALEALLETR